MFLFRMSFTGYCYAFMIYIYIYINRYIVININESEHLGPSNQSDV